MSSNSSSRRSFLRRAGTASLGGVLSSCGSTLTPFTTSGPIRRTPGKGQVVVDAHCHVFNGKDVDIAAYATALVQDKLTPAIAPIFQGYVKIFAAVLRAEAPPVDNHKGQTGELPILQEINAMVKRKGLRPGSEASYDFIENRMAHAFKARKTNDPQAVTMAIEWMLNPMNLLRSKKKLVDRIEAAIAADPKTAPAWEDIKIDATPAEVKTALRQLQAEAPCFFGHFINYRTVNAYEMLRQFNPRGSKPNIDLFTPATIDYDAWFNADDTPLDESGHASCVKSRCEGNRSLMAEMAVLFNGELMPLMGFCPRRAAECTRQPGAEREYRCETLVPSDPTCTPFEILKQAIANGSHLGVKMYPPMGFQATGNAELDRFGNHSFEGVYQEFFPRGLGAAMDAELKKLYEYCDKFSVPIMTHAVESHGSHPGYAKRSSPEFWLPVFDEEKARAIGLDHAHPNLRLSFAHLGGWHPQARTALGRLFEKKSHTTWPKQILDLVRNQRHVFSDIGDIAEIGKPGWATAFTEALHQWENETPSGCYRPSKKLIYGSDWFVLANADIFRQKLRSAVSPNKLVGPSYLQRWATYLSGAFPDSYRDIMGHNALRFFGLDHGPALDRVDHFLGTHDLTPGWRKKLKAALA